MSIHQSAATNHSMETSDSPVHNPRKRALLITLAVAAALFITSLLLQIQTGAYRSEFGAHADEPAHVVGSIG